MKRNAMKRRGREGNKLRWYETQWHEMTRNDMKGIAMKWNVISMEWNGMKRSKTKWNVITHDGIWVKRKEMKWNQLKRNQQKYNNMKFNEMKLNVMKRNDLNWKLRLIYIYIYILPLHASAACTFSKVSLSNMTIISNEMKRNEKTRNKRHWN